MPEFKSPDNISGFALENFFRFDPTELIRRKQAERVSTAGTGNDRGLTTDLRSLERVIGFLHQGVRMLDAAERDLVAINDTLARMKTLADDAANIAATGEEREQFQRRFAAEREALDVLARGSSYDGIKLLDGSFDYRFQTGIGAGELNRTRITISSLRVAKLNAYEQGESNPVAIAAVDVRELDKTNRAAPDEDPLYKTDAQIATDNALDRAREILSEVRAAKGRFATVIRHQEGTSRSIQLALERNVQVETERVQRELAGQEVGRIVQASLLRARDEVPRRTLTGLQVLDAVPGITRGSQSPAAPVALDIDAFIVANADLLQLIDKNDELRQEYFLDTARYAEPFTSRAELQGMITDYVTDRLGAGSKLDRGFLEKNTEVTNLLALDPRGLLELVAKDGNLQRLLSSNGALPEIVGKDVAAQAAGLFHENGPLDQAFFQRNASLAIYFLENQDIAARIKDRSASPIAYEGRSTVRNEVFTAFGAFDASVVGVGEEGMVATEVYDDLGQKDEVLTFDIYEKDGHVPVANFQVVLDATNNADLPTLLATLNGDASFSSYLQASSAGGTLKFEALDPDTHEFELDSTVVAAVSASAVGVTTLVSSTTDEIALERMVATNPYDSTIANQDQTLNFRINDRWSGNELADFSVVLNAGNNGSLAQAVNALNTDATFSSYLLAEAEGGRIALSALDPDEHEFSLYATDQPLANARSGFGSENLPYGSSTTYSADPETLHFFIQDQGGGAITDFQVTLDEQALLSLDTVIETLNTDASFSTYLLASRDGGVLEFRAKDPTAHQFSAQSDLVRSKTRTLIGSDSNPNASAEVLERSAGRPRSSTGSMLGNGLVLGEDLDEQGVAERLGSKEYADRFDSLAAASAEEILGPRQEVPAKDYAEGGFASTRIPTPTVLERDLTLARFAAGIEAVRGRTLRSFAGSRAPLLQRPGGLGLEELLEDYQIGEAFRATGRDHPLGLDFYRRNPAVARLVGGSAAVARVMDEQRELLGSVYGPPSERTYRFDHGEVLRQRLGTSNELRETFQMPTLAQRAVGTNISKLLDRMRAEGRETARPDGAKVELDG